MSTIRRLGAAIEAGLERGLFASRWLLTPIYFGLAVTLLMLMVVFVQELVHGAAKALSSPNEAIMLALSLIDLSLAANLVLIVTLSGYENFVSKIDTQGHLDRPSWMGVIDFSGMKMRLIASIVAISAVSLLKAFMRLASTDWGGEQAWTQDDHRRLLWLVGLHLLLVLSGVLFAVMDWLAAKTAAFHTQANQDGHG